MKLGQQLYGDLGNIVRRKARDERRQYLLKVIKKATCRGKKPGFVASRPNVANMAFKLSQVNSVGFSGEYGCSTKTLTERTVQRYLLELVDLGWVTRKKVGHHYVYRTK